MAEDSKDFPRVPHQLRPVLAKDFLLQVGLGGGGGSWGLDVSGGRHCCDGWDIPGAQWPSALHGVTDPAFLPGLGKEGPFQMALLSLNSPTPPDFPLWPRAGGQQVPRLGPSQSHRPWLRGWRGYKSGGL